MKYYVKIAQIEDYVIPDIEAGCEEEAIFKAMELFEGNKDQYHDDSGGKEEAFEIGQ